MSTTKSLLSRCATFFRERLEFYLRDVRGYAYDVVKAVLGADADDVVDALARAEAVKQVLHMPEFQAIGAACKRMRNILKQAAEKGIEPAAKFEDLPDSAVEEKNLATFVATYAAKSRSASQKRNNTAMRCSLLSKAREPVDTFFDKVMVMVEDQRLRANRLALLQILLKEFSTIADFSEIVTEGKDVRVPSSRELAVRQHKVDSHGISTEQNPETKRTHMATITLPETEVQETKKSTTKYVYFFGGGKADGNGKMKDVLGGKGAGLAEMTNAGLPVPPGFTIQTEACREYMRGGLSSKEVDRQMDEALAKLEALQGQKLGTGENPLLVSVRSGAKFSMPGMMDTILNLGLNDKSVEALAKRSNNPRFAADSYRRLIQMFGNVVLDIEKSAFDEVFDAKKKQKKTKLDTDLDAKASAGSDRRVQEGRQEACQARLPAGSARAVGDGARRRVPLMAERSRQALSPHQQHRRHARHRGQRAGDGVWQPGRHQRHGRGLHTQSCDWNERVLRRISDERAGRGRGFGRAHSGSDPRTAEDHARGL